MNKITDFLNSLKGKNIHLIGCTGSEGSSILDLLINKGVKNITAHDFIDKQNLEKNFKIWHKGISVSERNRQYSAFLKNLEKTDFHDQATYLEGIKKADIIFVPQSWRLYPQNKSLFPLKNRGVSFYSLTRLYLDYSNAYVIGVTGTVGKGSVANLIYHLLEKSYKKVYFAGNETWRLQIADRLSSMKASDYLVLEISHRQLMDGFTRAPDMVIYTNLYPNHLDETNFKDYCELKLSLAKKQLRNDTVIINFDNEILRNESENFKSNIVYYSAKNPLMNTLNIQKIRKFLLSINSEQYHENLLAASTAAITLGIPAEQILENLPLIPGLPARMEKIGSVNGIKIYDDIKSTTPWATLYALDALRDELIVILGGDTKNISYAKLTETLIRNKIPAYVLKSELSADLLKNYSEMNLKVFTDLESAVTKALSGLQKGGSLLVSPAAANFYTRFIKGKKSLRKIISSLNCTWKVADRTPSR